MCWMKIVYEGFDRGDHTGTGRVYWPNLAFQKEELEKQLIQIPKTKEEALNNQKIWKQLKDLNNP